MKKYPSSTIAFLEKKIGHLSNDLTKQLLYDALHKRRYGDNPLDNKGDHAEYKLLVEQLEKDYKDRLHQLRQQERQHSKQIDIEDAIRDARQPPIEVEAEIKPEPFCGSRDCSND